MHRRLSAVFREHLVVVSHSRGVHPLPWHGCREGDWAVMSQTQLIKSYKMFSEWEKKRANLALESRSIMSPNTWI